MLIHEMVFDLARQVIDFGKGLDWPKLRVWVDEPELPPSVVVEGQALSGLLNEQIEALREWQSLQFNSRAFTEPSVVDGEGDEVTLAEVRSLIAGGGKHMLLGRALIGKTTLCYELLKSIQKDFGKLILMIYVPLSVHQNGELEDVLYSYWSAGKCEIPEVRGAEDVLQFIGALREICSEGRFRVVWVFDELEKVSALQAYQSVLSDDFGFSDILFVGTQNTRNRQSMLKDLKFWEIQGFTKKAQHLDAAEKVFKADFAGLSIESTVIVEFARNLQLTELLESPQVLRLICIACALQNQEKHFKVFSLFTFGVKESALFWLARSMLGVDPDGLKWKTLVKVSSENALSNCEEVDMEWLERCGFIQRHECRWSFECLRSYFESLRHQPAEDLDEIFASQSGDSLEEMKFDGIDELNMLL
jgi:hypothetical protein